MSRRFAQNTIVSVEKSRAEIEQLITRYGAQQTAFMSAPGRALIMFEANDRRIVFELPLPDIGEDRFRRTPGRRKSLTPEGRVKAWEQDCRQAWRALALVIKAKLEAVKSGITTFEDEFLAHIMMPDGQTVGSHVKPAVAAWYSGGMMRPLLPPPTSEKSP
jgi:hypothetical protein